MANRLYAREEIKNRFKMAFPLCFQSPNHRAMPTAYACWPFVLAKQTKNRQHYLQ